MVSDLENDSDVFFSIITPCFNSSKTLWTTYMSLVRQSVSDFEWILVDDASTDNGLTLSIINKIKNEAPFKVKSIYLEENNFGSKSVYAASVVANGKYVAVLDHDDQLSENCLFVVKRYADLFLNDPGVAGVCGRCVNENGKLIGKKFEFEVARLNEGFVRFKKNITSELFQFTKLELIQKYFLLMKPGYTNGFVWSKISEKFDYIYVNDVFRIYDTALPSSYSNTKSMLTRYPENKYEALKSTIFSYRKYLRFNIYYSSQLIGSCLRHAINANIELFEAISGFDFYLKLWSLVIYPVAVLKSKNLI